MYVFRDFWMESIMNQSLICYFMAWNVWGMKLSYRKLIYDMVTTNYIMKYKSGRNRQVREGNIRFGYVIALEMYKAEGH